MSWYRQYRPQTLADLHLQSVRQTMLNLIERGELPQVLLFAGPKGTGKTSTARILAALVNDPANQAAMQSLLGKTKKSAKKSQLQEPNLADDLVRRIYNGSSLAVHELDAASHRGIDEVRALKERVALPPQEGSVSVYILDEVHMLTTEAFNALLKLLEEPPAHAFFILATTELHKLPATVVSRCFVVHFTKASQAEILEALQPIMKAEHLQVDAAALELIAERAEGSFRDAVKLAELVVRETGQLQVADVERLVAPSVITEIEQLVLAVVNKKPSTVGQIFAAWRAQDVNQDYLEKQICRFLHTALLQGLGVVPGEPVVNDKVALFLIQEINAVCGQKGGPIALLNLELKCLEMIMRSQQKKGESGGGKVSKKAPGSVVMAEEAAEEPQEALIDPVHVAETNSPSVMPVTPELEPVDPAQVQQLLARWSDFLAGVKQRNSSLAAVLGSGQPTVGDQGQAQVQVYYKFHQEQLQQPKFLRIIQESAETLLGKPVHFEFVLAEPVVVAAQTVVPLGTAELHPLNQPVSKEGELDRLALETLI